MKNFSSFYTIRFLFIPETIGAITWLAKNEKNIEKIAHGLVITCIGDKGEFTYKKSRKGVSEIDKMCQYVLKRQKIPHEIVDFFPTGSDERQFCSPGIDLNVGSLMRTPYGEFSEYHTSLDDLKFIEKDALSDSLEKYHEIILEVDKTMNNINPEDNNVYVNQISKCEPQLGKRGIYQAIGGQKNESVNDLALLWILNQSNGENSLLDISIKANIPFETILQNAKILEKFSLIKRI